MSFAAAVFRSRSLSLLTSSTSSSSSSIAAVSRTLTTPTGVMHAAVASPRTATAAPAPVPVPAAVTDEDGSKTLYTRDLIQIIANTHKLNKAESKRILITVIDTIADSLVEQKSVRFGSLGTFSVYQSAPRTSRNPRTQELLIIPAKMRVRFRTSGPLKAMVQPVTTTTTPTSSSTTTSPAKK